MCFNHELCELTNAHQAEKPPILRGRLLKLWLKLKELMIGRYNISEEEHLCLYKE